MQITPEVEHLFKKYEEGSQEFNYRDVLRLFANRIVIAGPGDLVFINNNVFTRWRSAKGFANFYRKAGLKTIVILGLIEDKVSDQFSLVKVTWGATFSKPGSPSFEFHVTYLVRKKNRKAEIVMIIAHEDERKILEGYGIIN